MQNATVVSQASWLLVVVFLLPLVPALVMGFGLPIAAKATGKFMGLKWQLGGGIASYAFVLLMMIAYTTEIRKELLDGVKKQSEAALAAQKARLDQELEQQKANADAAKAELGEPWTISGNIHKPDGSVPNGAQFYTEPKNEDFRGTSGEFSVSVLLARRKSGESLHRNLLIVNDNFFVVQLSLPWDDEKAIKDPVSGYTVSRVPERVREFRIDEPIVLVPLPAVDNK